MLVRPKDKSPDEKKCGIIYQLECANCEQCYIGETARSFETRPKEHSKTKASVTAVGEHLMNTGHKLAIDKHKVLARQDQYWLRKIHEAIEIKLRKPGLNRDAGYNLPPVYNGLLTAILAPGPTIRKVATPQH
jgi:hypothetical protein